MLRRNIIFFALWENAAHVKFGLENGENSSLSHVGNVIPFCSIEAGFEEIESHRNERSPWRVVVVGSAPR